MKQVLSVHKTIINLASQKHNMTYIAPTLTSVVHLPTYSLNMGLKYHILLLMCVTIATLVHGLSNVAPPWLLLIV